MTLRRLGDLLLVEAVLALLALAVVASCARRDRPDPVVVLAPQATVAELASLSLVATRVAGVYGVQGITVTVALEPTWPTCSTVPQGPHVGYTHPGGSVALTCPEAWPHEALHALGIGDLAHADPRWGDPADNGGVARGEFGQLIHELLVSVYGADPWEVSR